MAAFEWSPIVRAWFNAVQREPAWETLNPHREQLLREFCRLALHPDEPQAYFRGMALRLAPGGRYAPPDLDWCLISDTPEEHDVAVDAIAASAAVAASIGAGSAAAVSCAGFRGTVYKSARLDGETLITNRHPRLKLCLSGTKQRSTGILWDEVDWQRYPDDFAVEEFSAPYGIMRSVWPEEYAEQLEIVKVIVPRLRQDYARSTAFTVSSHQGAIFVAPSGDIRTLELVVHEKAHVKLRYVEEIWPLLEPEQTVERFSVAWRDDPRPIEGIFEGIYVFTQVAAVLRRCQASGGYEVAQRLRQVIESLAWGFEVIGRHARLTADGRVFLERLYSAYERAADRVKA